MLKQTLLHGEAIERLSELRDNSVGMVFVDLPYGTTAAKWDEHIDHVEMWRQLSRVVQDNRAICFTAVQPFTSQLITSNLKGFKHEWIWNKVTGRGHLVAKKRPMQQHESVVVFEKRGRGILYNPQMVPMDKPVRGRAMEASRTSLVGGSTTGTQGVVERTHKYPKTIQTFSMDKNCGHPTQKPVALVEYMIRTYSNEGDVVLDFTAGSGTTAVAAVNTGRDAICIERDFDYYNLMRRRVSEAVSAL